MNDLVSCNGVVGQYFGFPVTNLEHLYNDKKASQGMIEHLDECNFLNINCDLESL